MTNAKFLWRLRKLFGRMLPVIGAMLLEELQRKLQDESPEPSNPRPNPPGVRKKATRQPAGSPPDSASPSELELGRGQQP
jgi:hypothetical protein